MRRGAAISILVERGRRAASSPLVFNREPMQGSPLVALNWPCDGSSLTLGTRCSWPHRVLSVVNVTCNRAPASRYVIVAQHEPAAIAACPAQSTRHSLRITCIRWARLRCGTSTLARIPCPQTGQRSTARLTRVGITVPAARLPAPAPPLEPASSSAS